MNRRSVVSCLTAMLALTACDPLFSTQYRQPIAPLSPDQCVEAALRGSPHIAIVSREKNPYGHEVTSFYHIVVRDSATVGGYVAERLERIPVVGDELPFANYDLRVEEMDGMRVAVVRFVPSARAAQPAEGDEDPTTGE